MTTFITKAARVISEDDSAFTSLDVANYLLTYLKADVAEHLSAKANMLELFAIGEHAVRRGAYQVSSTMFPDLQWSLRINKYTISAIRVPGFNRVVFHLNDGQWSTRTKSTAVIKDFLSTIVEDESNNHMFEKR